MVLIVILLIKIGIYIWAPLSILLVIIIIGGIYSAVDTGTTEVKEEEERIDNL